MLIHVFILIFLMHKLNKKLNVSLKVFELLRLVRKDEWKDFEKFVSSPYFNKGRNYLPLLRVLKDHHPEFDSERLTKEFLYCAVYPGRKFNQAVINTVLSGLSRLCEEFLLYCNFTEKKQADIRLLREYAGRGYDAKAKLLSVKIEKQIRKSPENSLSFFENLDRIDALQSYYAMVYEKERRSATLNTGLRNVIYFMMMQSFIFEKEILLYNQRYADEEFRSTLAGRLLSEIDFRRLLDLIMKEDENAYRVLSIYGLLIDQLKDISNDDKFYEIRSMLEQIKGSLERESVNKIRLNLVSVCNMKNNIGKGEFMNESYSIMKELVRDSFYDRLENSTHFPPSHFRNIVKAGIGLGDTDWVEEFVRNNAHKLEHSQIEPLKHFSLAKIAFARREFDRSLEHLARTRTDNLVFRLDIRKLTAMIYFETRSFSSLVSLLNAYSQLVAKKGKNNESILLRHRNFIRYLKKLESLAGRKGQKDELELLRDSVEHDNVSDKNWLLEKIRDQLTPRKSEKIRR